MAVDNAQDYARMLDVVVTSASTSDFETPLPIVHPTVPGGWTSPPAAGCVKEVRVDRAAAKATVTFDTTQTNIPELRDTLLSSGYRPTRTAS